MMISDYNGKRALYCLAVSMLAAALALACCSCGDKTASNSLDSATIGEIDAAMAMAMEKYESPGALVGIWTKDGATLVKAYGLACVDPEQAMTENMDFRAGSITKTFTANLILQLVDQSKLSLDDPVSRYVEGIPDSDRITVRMLLNHSSGLFNYGGDELLNETIMVDPHKVWTPEELVAAAVVNPPYFPPGQGCMYSNTNYVLLGMIIEKVTGRSVEQELASRITGRLGLKGTYLAEGYGMVGDYTHGYQYDPETGDLYDATEYLDQSIVWTAGGMISVLEDLHAWGRSLVEGELISPALREAMTTGMLELPGMTEYFGYPMQYGLGIIDMGGWLGHSGMEAGYSSVVFNLPSRETTVVVLLNASDIQEPGMRLFMKVAEILFPEETPW